MQNTHGRGRLRLQAFLIGVFGWALCGAAEGTTRDVLTDTKLYFTAPFHWDAGNWTYFGSSLLAIGIAHEYDDDVRAHFVGTSHAAGPGQDPKSMEDAVPAALILGGTLTAALLMRDHDGYDETWSMVEASALSGIAAFSLKYAFGRERPNDTANVDAWFQGGDSFPSMHTTLAFSIGTVFAESGNDRYRWIRRIVGYGVGAGTAYLRLRENVHWLSDTAAGAALGLSTAQFVMNRSQSANRHAFLQVIPIRDGLMLSYSGPLH